MLTHAVTQYGDAVMVMPISTYTNTRDKYVKYEELIQELPQKSDVMF